jgi:hypothetical protein
VNTNQPCPPVGGRERNVWQVGITYRSLVLNSAYQAGVTILLMLSGVAGRTAGFGLRNRGAQVRIPPGAPVSPFSVALYTVSCPQDSSEKHQGTEHTSVS